MNIARNLTKNLTLAAALSMLAGMPAIAQVATCQGAPGVDESAVKAARAPLSKDHGLVLPAQLPVIALPPLDNAALLLRDETRNDGNILWISDGRDVAFDFSQGQWFDTRDGGRIWAIDILSPTAIGMRLHFTNFNLPAGASLVAYDSIENSSIAGPYTGTGPMDLVDFWAETTFGQATRVELYLPPGAVLPAAPFGIDSLQHQYRDPDAPDVQVPSLLGCHQDATCWPGWATVGQAVARMQYVVNGNGGACTGQLINTYSSDLTPYFTTANHCISTEAVANTLEAYWFFQTPSCNGTPPAITSCPKSSYARMFRQSATGDYALLMLEGAVPRNAYWLGWSTGVPATGDPLTCVSHPAGSNKRISFGNMKSTVTGCNGISTTPTTHVEASWFLGTVEPGSSGSGIYANDQLLYGVYSCQSTVCPVTPATNLSNYGKFSYIFNAAGTLLNGGDDDGYEPNDSCGVARYLGGVGYNNWGSTNWVKIYDEDYYRLSVPNGGTVVSAITFFNSFGDIDMGLYDACGGNLLASSSSTNDGETIQYTNNTGSARDYYVRIYLYNDTRNYYNFATNVIAPSPPVTDACGNAAQMVEGVTINGSTAFASTDGSTSCGNSDSSRDVWYYYYAPCSGVLNIDTYGSDYDTVLSAHTGCTGTAANTITCNDDANAPERWSAISLSVDAGQVYRIRVAGYSTAFGNFVLNSSLSAPYNDACGNALEVFEGSVAFNSCGCTTDGTPEPSCDLFNAPQIDNDFWNYYVATANGTLTVSTCGADYDSKIALYDASLGCPTDANSALICNDDFCGLQSSFEYHVTAGSVYYIRTGGYRGARGSGELSLSLVADPPSCPADFNGDTVVDFFDYLDFVDAFSADDPAADFNGDTVIDFFDYLDFVDAFSTGC